MLIGMLQEELLINTSCPVAEAITMGVKGVGAAGRHLSAPV